jgi:beta-galactosidase
MWSIGNEVPEQGVENGHEIARSLVRICHEEDPTRPTTAAFNASDQAIQNGLADAVDVPGWNYRPTHYARYRQEHPDWPMYGSETASTVSSRGEYYLPADEEKPAIRDNQQVNSFDLCTTEWSTTPDQEFTALDENPTLMGEFVWTGFDYLGEPTPYSTWPSRSSYFGIIDLAGIPKSRYWLYKSRWSPEPVLHLHPHWTWTGYEGSPIPVHCYTNMDAVELFVNGVSFGRRRKSEKTLVNRHRIVWPEVPYEPGELKAIGYDADGSVVSETTLRTAGAPSRILLAADRKQITGDGDDMVFVHARIVDSDGVVVPTATNELQFSTDGSVEIVGVCNGDPTDLRSLTGNRMAAFHGECVVYVRSTAGARGTGVIAVSALAIGSAKVEFTIAGEQHGTHGHTTASSELRRP